jgi:hypothetical protein
MTADELRRAEAAYQASFRRTEKLRQERNAAVTRALEAGMTHAEVAAITGLSRGRIGQLA